MQTNTLITSELTKMKHDLSKPRDTLGTFVEYVDNVKKAHEKFNYLLEQKRRLEEMKSTLNKHRIKEESSSQIHGNG